MLLSALFLAATAIAAPACHEFRSIQTKDGGLCLSSAGRFDQGAPLQLGVCAAGQKDQGFKWEPFTFDGAEAGVEYLTLHSEGGLCVASRVPIHGYTFGPPVLGPCQLSDQFATEKYRPMWVKDRDNICMSPKKEGDNYPTGPNGLCFSAKELVAGAAIDLAKDFTGKPIDWKL